jgi:AraC-like DNA-binding protein
MEPAAHIRAVIIVMRQGCGVALVGDERVPFRAGQAMLLTPHVRFGLVPDGVVRFDMLYVAAEYLVPQILHEYSGLFTNLDSADKVMACLLARPYRLLDVPGEHVDMLGGFLDSLVARTVAERIVGDTFKAQRDALGVLDVVLPLLAGQRGPSPVECGAGLRPWGGTHAPLTVEVQATIACLKEHYHRRWTLADLAGLVRMSVDGLRKAFLAQMGISPLGYQRRLRVARMLVLLGSTRMSVPQIAVAVGWESVNHAVRQFAAIIGKTPAAWRRHHGAASGMTPV